VEKQVRTSKMTPRRLAWAEETDRHEGGGRGTFRVNAFFLGIQPAEICLSGLIS